MFNHIKRTTIRPEEVDTAKTRRRIEDFLRKNTTPEDLIRVAETLGVEVALIDTHKDCPYSDSKRPCFGPNQVRCRHQLKVGHRYLHHHGTNGKGTSFVVVREPFYGHDNVDGWWIEVDKTLLPSGRIYREFLSLQDTSIEPYTTGNWNTRNYFTFTSTSKCCHCHHC